MKYKLINPPNKNFSIIQQILFNRGIKQNDIQHYLSLSDNDINDYKLFGEQNLKAAARILAATILNKQDAFVVIDSDVDGFTASALLLNYLHDIFPQWVQQHITLKMHEGKQHGLADCIDELQLKRYPLVICADSASNDYLVHKLIENYGGNTIILDHHLADKISENAIVINNQLSNYPNKQLSGVGVVWQFCRYIDNVLNYNYANNYLDLVALGLVGDMQSLRSFETRYLITKGFKTENIKNPFIAGMIDKNNFPLSKSDYISSQEDSACTPMGAAFFIVPLVNAITRSGTQEQKYLIFNSMLKHKAFEKIPSTKRGHKIGQLETLLAQAVRTVTNVKNRQTKAENEGMELLESQIKEKQLLNHKILLFLLEPGMIEPNIRGLVANKIMAKYQRPCLVLTKTDRDTYEGSGRGYTKSGVDNLKQILDKSLSVVYVQGHQNAFGISLCANQINSFIAETDELLKEMSSEAIYRVDYEFNENENNNQKILTIAQMNDYWGQDIDRALVKINFKITNSNFQVMKSNTLKFNLPNNLSIIKFNGTDQQIEKFTTQGFIEVNAICKCNANKWCGNVSPQLILQDYEIIDSSKYYF